MSRRNTYLDSLAARTGIRPQFYDPDGQHYGTPTYPFRFAPRGLLTRRQLRAAGLAPGGHDPVAQILWRHYDGIRRAWLYDQAAAVPKRQPTAAQLEAVGKALAARKTCPTCGVQQPYCLPKSLGECLACADAARAPRRDSQAAAGSEAA
jgi:hypothetical protein